MQCGVVNPVYVTQPGAITPAHKNNCNELAKVLAQRGVACYSSPPVERDGKKARQAGSGGGSESRKTESETGVQEEVAGVIGAVSWQD